MSLFGLVACSPSEPDPATAEPVNPLPGLYRVTLSGTGVAALAGSSSKDDGDEVCVRPSDSARFADLVARNHFTLHPLCRTQTEPRVGNVIRGVITCPLDPGMSTGTSTTTYEGVVSADQVEVTGRMSIDARPIPGALSPEEQRGLTVGVALMERMGLKVTAVRTGDCI